MEMRRLPGDRRGAVSVEFALTLPIITMLVVGVFEVALVGLGNSALESAALEAARYGTTGAIWDGVSRADRVRGLIEARTFGLFDPDALEIDSRVYPSFAAIGEREPYSDANRNGAYDQGESYTDINENGRWDDDMGTAGLGGPEDVVVYTVRYAWHPITPFMAPVIGTLMLSASVATRNEPY